MPIKGGRPSTYKVETITINIIIPRQFQQPKCAPTHTHGEYISPTQYFLYPIYLADNNLLKWKKGKFIEK